MVTPTQTARLLDTREGFDAVDFAEVGLPIFRLTIEAVTLSRQDMPTTHEFVLRAISIGESQSAGIARLLGLSEGDILDAIQLLRYDKCVDVMQGVSSAEAQFHCDTYHVTDLGNERLIQGKRTPRDEVLVFDFDGIRRRPIKLGSESVLRAKDLGDRRAIQIRPYPIEPPHASDLPLAEVARAVRHPSGKGFARGVLAVRRIIRRDNLFRPAIGILFRSRVTQEMQIAFAIGDQLMEDYEIEFARCGGVKKPGLIRISAEADGRFSLRHILGSELFAQIANPEEASRRRLEVTLASQDLAAHGKKLERLKRRPQLRHDEREELTEIENRLTQAHQKLEEVELRPLAPYEHWELLHQALETARKRLVITSSDIDANIMHSLNLRRLDERLHAGVAIRIETSAIVGPETRGRTGSFEPSVELWLRGKQEPGLTLARRSQEVAGLYFLIKDADLAVISNRPFLSGREAPFGFIPTVGIVSQNLAIVAKIARLIGL
jgi:hypothetical protein